MGGESTIMCTSSSANEKPWLQRTKWLKQQGVQEGIGKVMKQEDRCLCERKITTEKWKIKNFKKTNTISKSWEDSAAAPTWYHFNEFDLAIL